MAAIECAQCGKEIDDRNSSCFYCGKEIKRKLETWKKVVGWIVLIILVVGLSKEIGKEVGKKLTASQYPLLGVPISGDTEYLALLEKEVEKQLYGKEDEFTEAIGIYTAENLFAYQYRFKNINTSNLDVNIFESTLKESLIQDVCGERSFNEILQKGIVVAFVYYPEQGKDIFADVRITKADCTIDPLAKFKDKK